MSLASLSWMYTESPYVHIYENNETHYPFKREKTKPYNWNQILPILLFFYSVIVTLDSIWVNLGKMHGTNRHPSKSIYSIRGSTYLTCTRHLLPMGTVLMQIDLFKFLPFKRIYLRDICLAMAWLDLCTIVFLFPLVRY